MNRRRYPSDLSDGDDGIRWFVCDPRDQPTGWACGVFEDHAIAMWVGDWHGKLSKDEVDRRWAEARERGYSVQAFRLVAVPLVPGA
jgi:hypothetical protein